MFDFTSKIGFLRCFGYNFMARGVQSLNVLCKLRLSLNIIIIIIHYNMSFRRIFNSKAIVSEISPFNTNIVRFISIKLLFKQTVRRKS